MCAYRIEILHNLEGIRPQQWNAVAGDTLQKGYCWQKYKQAAQAAGRPRAWTAFVTVWQQAQLVGVATAYQYPLPLPFAAPVLRHLSKWLLAPTNPINFLLPPTVAPFADETAVFPLLLKGIRQLVRQHWSLGVRMTFLEPQKQQSLLTHLRQANYRVTDGIWETSLPVQWPDFAGYEKSLNHKHRNQLRKQRKKAAQAGIKITTAPPTAIEPIYALLQKVAAKNRSEVLYNANFLTHAQEILGSEQFTLFRAVYQNQTVACLLMYHDQTTAQLAAIGLDYHISQTYNLYRVLIYAAIEHSIAIGMTCIKGGMSRYDLKRRIGFVSYPTLTATDAWLPPVKKGYGFMPASLQDSSTQ